MKSPFKFLDSFTKEDREIFFGREKEIEELYRRAFRSKIMLVYGVSGTGKSSLINCGLANKFKDEDWLPLNIRRGKNIMESMYAAIVASSLTARSQYVASEIQFKKFVKSLYLDHYKPIYFIFDQFEELFIFGSKEEKSLFVRTVKALVDSDIQCRFIFVMREEYMASVTEFEKHIPIFFSNRVRIENMDINNAIQAIKGPCKVFNISVEDGFPEALIENLSPGSPDIELTYLQVFLDKVYRLAVEEMESGKGDKQNVSFTIDQLQKVGNVSDLLGTFLNEQIALLDDPDAALAVLKSFVSIKGTKKQMGLEDVKDYAQTLGKSIKESVLLEMLQNFVNLRILRDKDQYERYELRHDSLATKIFEKISVVEKDILEIRQFIEDGWHNWQKRGVLLSANDLDYIAPYESRLFLSQDHLNLINQSKNQLEKVKRKRRVIFIASTFILMIAFAAFTVWALIERNTSKKQEIIANSNYYNALSKELVINDPTKALRIAEYACKLNPSENNYQNLVNIYSGNEFYFTYMPARSFNVINFKILSKTGNIAIRSSDKIITLDPNGKKIRETNFTLPQTNSFDISSDEKYYLFYSSYISDTVKIYDLSGNLNSKISIKNNIYRTFFLPDCKKILSITFNDTLIILSTFSLTGEKLGTREMPLPTYPPCFLNYNSSDSIFYLADTNGLKCWIPNKNQIFKTKFKISKSEIIYNGQFITSDRIVMITDYDTIRIFDLKGNLYNSWYAGDDENKGFGYYQPLIMTDLNLICTTNGNVIKIWNFDGQNTAILKLGISSSIPQYNSFNKELLFYSNNHILGYIPNSLQNELIRRKENKKTTFYTSGNNIREINGDEENILILNENKIESKPIKFQDDKFFYKIPGTLTVRTHFPKNYKLPDKPEVTIYNIYDKSPLVQLKGLTEEMPGRIVFSKDENLILSYNQLIVYSDGYVGTSFTTFFNLFNKDGVLIRTFPLKSLSNPNIRISSDNKNILVTDYNTAILLDTSGNQLFKYVGHNSNIHSIDISDNGNYILTGSYDKTARLWTRNGKVLKVINTEGTYFSLSFLPGELIFQIDDNKFAKLYDINGVLIQKIPVTNNNPIIYSQKDRLFYYIDNEGIHRTRMKESLDSFLISNNHNDLSISDKIEYKISSVSDLLKSSDPKELLLAGRFFSDMMDKKIDISEKKDAMGIAEKFFQKALKFDTLHVFLATSLSDLSVKKYLYFNDNITDEIEKYYKIMLKQNNQYDLIEVLSYYVNKIDIDSTYIDFGYPEKAISIAEKLVELNSINKNIKTRIASNCSNLAFVLLSYKSQYKNSLIAVKIAVKADSTFLNTYTNLPLAYLFNNMYDEAVKVYLKWKDKPYMPEEGFKNFKEVFLSDFADLERRGITHPDFEKIKELLNK
jgi:WD40 repeat protein